MYIYIYTYIHNKLFHITYSCTSLGVCSCIYIYLGVALGSNQWCAFQARENGGKLFFIMSLWIIWLNMIVNEMRVWWTLDDPHPPLTWTEDLQGSKVISKMFSHLNDAQSPILILPLPQPKDPLPRTACFGDKRWSSAVVILRGMEDQLIGRSWVLKFFPSQNSWKSSENPSENKTLPGGFWLRRAPGFDIHTFPCTYSSLGWLVLTSLAGWGPKSICFTSQKGISHWKLAHKNSKTSSAPKKISPAFTNPPQKKKDPHSKLPAFLSAFFWWGDAVAPWSPLAACEAESQAVK